MENIDNVNLFVQSLDNSVDQLTEKLEPILKKSLEEKIAASDSQVERIKIYNNYSYVLISILFSYLKTLGINTDQHPIMKELTRIKSYMKRYKELEAKLASKDTSKEDAEAARTFIQNTLGTKLNGGGAAISSNMSSPAISSSNFAGVHTKFSDPENNSDSESTSKPKSEPTSKTSAKKKISSKPKGKASKVTKPQSKSKRSNTK
ncbi:DEHA2F26202p [Debaryomyces hansenii CBS767]|uniref:Exosome complex protein n=1 Tax=Debaryomyces hansenii (strain ATCC 36239 / CBS 767 / BCRC 21394 / JCM 1990 / NBRC 0083 / IGC 2968) TaxID=284592 RepID=Q6BJZ2_DEBHA|nr:DEHA2F26202p [Debaryomyces hansenii CBS767]CAG89900.2 DEHA2F26202p [Debaryomyces hansenii CBS767]|eukprot:XP_461479.2 DEHA2F26202p [Debaryomyces hansenii CBS767]